MIARRKLLATLAKAAAAAAVVVTQLGSATTAEAGHPRKYRKKR